MSERIAEIIKAAASAMGVSKSEFTRQAVLEKLERMNVVSSEVKAALAQEVAEHER